MDSDNAEAWQVYQQMQSRFAVDFGLTRELFAAATSGWSPEEKRDTLARLALIYNVLSPPPQRQGD